MRRRSGKGMREGRATGCEKVGRRVRTLRTLAIRDDEIRECFRRGLTRATRLSRALINNNGD